VILIPLILGYTAYSYWVFKRQGRPGRRLPLTMPGNNTPQPAPGPWWKRIGWFVLIWCASVAALGAFAWLLRQVAV
jgi:hypothetical protein